MAGGVGGVTGGSAVYRGLLQASGTNVDLFKQRNDALVQSTAATLDNNGTELNRLISSPPPSQSIALQALRRGGLVDQFA